MPRPRVKKPVHLQVTGLAPLPPAIEERERAVTDPALARLFDAPSPSTNDDEEARDGQAR